MKVAVITPYHDEVPDEWLWQCHQSVVKQTAPCVHFLVGDGTDKGAHLCPSAFHITLSDRCGDYGDTPRALGSFYAIGRGFDAVAYLDADNWFYPQHVATIEALHKRSGAAILTARRNFHRLDGSYMAECLTSDGENFSDTNCLCLTQKAFFLCAVWATMDPIGHPIDDRVMWLAVLNSGLPRAHSQFPTVGYRATHAGFYTDLGEQPPPGASTSKNVGLALQAWRKKGLPELKLAWRYRRGSAGEAYLPPR